MKDWKTTGIGYALAGVNALGAYLQANGDWSHINVVALLSAVLMAVWGHVQADSK